MSKRRAFRAAGLLLLLFQKKKRKGKEKEKERKNQHFSWYLRNFMPESQPRWGCLFVAVAVSPSAHVVALRGNITLDNIS